jgi:hypothetical protein
MPIGPGKYDDLCTVVRETAEAKAAIIIILDGNKGNGFSVQSTTSLSPNSLANILDRISKELRNRQGSL